MLVLSEDQRLLRDSVVGLLDQRAPVASFRALRGDPISQGFDRELWSAMVGMGWPGILAEETHGGLDFGFVGAAVLCEEAGRRLTASPFVSTAMMAATALRLAGGAAEAAWLPRLVAGEVAAAIAVDETPHHRPDAIGMVAAPVGNRIRLDGRKVFVAEGGGADVFLVAARLGRAPNAETGFVVVERETPGLAVEPVRLVDARGNAELDLDGVVVEPDRVLRADRGGTWLLERVLDAGRLGLAAELGGAAQECLARTLGYVRQRRQFDRTIGSFQAVQHRLARLYCEIEVLKSAILAAAQAMDRDPEAAAPLVSLAKAKADDVATLAASEAVQLHGGIGMTDEVDIGLFLKRVRVASALYGGWDFHADRFALMNGY